MYTNNKLCGYTAESGETVPAGEACRGICGISDISDGTRLPEVHIQEQTYTNGFCPCEALQYGTMFPELLG